MTAQEAYEDAASLLELKVGVDSIRLHPEVRETMINFPEVGARMLLKAFAETIRERGQEMTEPKERL